MRLIDADALERDLRESYEELKKIRSQLVTLPDMKICDAQLCTFLEAILRVKEQMEIKRPHGKWKEVVPELYECSACGVMQYIPDEPMAYCPHCGATMDEGANHEN